ncbi:MAG: nuclear transport factor 2 family protein [Hyphomicrobiales bacterium]|nr:MAG: nuclear transport factor 2 family protein [Hyphomicrobiales bacterium]
MDHDPHCHRLRTRDTCTERGYGRTSVGRQTTRHTARRTTTKGNTMSEQLVQAAHVYDWDEHVKPPIGTVERALWLAHWHMEWENPEQLDKLAELYHPEVEWETPGRRIYQKGNVPKIIENYRAICDSLEFISARRVDRFATPDRVFDDSEALVKLVSGHGFPNHPMPVGSLVDMRIVHSFHIKDGLIIRENSYELWRKPV